MKRSLAVIAAGLSLVALNVGSTVPGERHPTSAPAATSEQAPRTQLLAQEGMPTCELDGRKVPNGTSICIKKSVQVCRGGSWVNSGKPC
jgi:hypothetical protein